jgi:hypothetical protein
VVLALVVAVEHADLPAVFVVALDGLEARPASVAAAWMMSRPRYDVAQERVSIHFKRSAMSDACGCHNEIALTGPVIG